MTESGKEEKRVHLRYMRYLLRHKWFVFIECCRLGIPVRGLLHDLSKFRPSEWISYARSFYSTWGYKFNGGMLWEFDRHKQYMEDFDRAWLAHQHRNSHHWQHHILREDDGDTRALVMPTKDAKEMLADWIGAGLAIHGHRDIREWYERNRHKIVLDPNTRAWIEWKIKRQTAKEKC